MADTYKTLISVDTVTDISDTDFLIVNDSDAVKQITKANLLDEVTTSISENASNIATNTSDISDIDDRVTTLEGGTITTDTTLSVSGMPADAEAVGDEVGDLKSDLSDIVTTSQTYTDITDTLTEVGEGYYNNPATMGLTQWADNENTLTYSLQGYAGDTYQVGSYSYYGCRTYFLYDPDTDTVSTIFPSTGDATWHEDEFTLDSDCVIYFGTRSATAYLAQFYVNKAVSTTLVNGAKVADGTIPITALSDSANPLYGKTALFFGDSICHGTSVGSDSDYYGYGWAGRIGEKNDMTWYNLGISGRTVLYNETGESNDVVTAYSTYTDADYIILEACLNDGFQQVTQGSVSDSYTDTFDNTADYCQAFEYMLQTCITQWSTARIGVIIPQRVSSSRPDAYQELARTICKKWSIPYIDLFYESGLVVENTTQAAIMFSDGETHLTDEGYEMITPKIEAWMKTL